MEEIVKESKIVKDARYARKILKGNPEIKVRFCRYCGAAIGTCECKQPCEVVDLKPYKYDKNKTVFIFANTPEFRAAYEEVSSYYEKKEAQKAEQVKEEEPPVEA